MTDIIEKLRLGHLPRYQRSYLSSHGYLYSPVDDLSNSSSINVQKFLTGLKEGFFNPEEFPLVEKDGKMYFGILPMVEPAEIRIKKRDSMEILYGGVAGVLGEDRGRFSSNLIFKSQVIRKNGVLLLECNPSIDEIFINLWDINVYLSLKV